VAGPKRVLVVDSDPDARRRAVESLGQRLRCVEVGTAEGALRELAAGRFDLVLLELYLRDLSGLGLLRLIRESPETGRTPILVVSAQASEIDRVLAFEAGADDFLAKPYYAPELAVRARTLLRAFEASPPLAAEEGARGIVVDSNAGRVEVQGRRVPLTPTELRVLAILVAEKGRVVRRRDLIERLRGPGAGRSERAVDAHVKSIRRKLGPARGILETVRGVGYRFCEPPPEATAPGAAWSADRG
jgi:two-component system phosphate regulon response regulator PhoB